MIEDIGRQIWHKASVFRFGWRAIYDASPLPGRGLTEAEFSRFVDTEAMPILTRSLPRFLATQQAVLEEIAVNPEVQNVVKQSLIKISKDPAMQAVLLRVLRESILENGKLQKALLAIWNGPEMEMVMSMTDQRLEANRCSDRRRSVWVALYRGHSRVCPDTSQQDSVERQSVVFAEPFSAGCFR